MRYLKVVIGISVLAPVIIIAILNIVFCGTDVIYVSSDGKWSERQMLYKNREFKDIVSSFEEYKVKCNAPDVKLERLRSRPEWIILGTWISNQNHMKSTVPLSTTISDVTFGFSTFKIEPAACYKSD